MMSRMISRMLAFKRAAVLAVTVALVSGAWLATARAAKKEPPVWSVDLEKRFKLQTFDRPISTRWTGEQGVVFLSPDKVLVYQVNRLREQRKLAPRSKTGGAGNFALQIRVMDARDGRDLKQLDLTTDAEQSSVVPVSNDRFVIRTGDQMFLYSPDFQRLAQKDLPLKRAASTETWTIAVSPSGAEMALVHDQIFYEPQLLMDGTVMNEGKALTDVEILDPATLQTRKQFTLPHSLAFWTLLDGKFVSSDPAHSYSHGEVGTLDFAGNWKPIMTGFKIEHNECSYHMTGVGPDAVALYGCDKLLGLTTEGQKLFSRDDLRTSFNAMIARGDYLAMQCNRYRVGRSTPSGGTYVQTVPDRIEVMRLSKLDKVFSVPMKNDRSYFAISQQGDLAVVEGSVLRMYGLGR
jgi:hypothetical protein